MRNALAPSFLWRPRDSDDGKLRPGPRTCWSLRSLNQVVGDENQFLPLIHLESLSCGEINNPSQLRGSGSDHSFRKHAKADGITAGAAGRAIAARRGPFQAGRGQRLSALQLSSTFHLTHAAILLRINPRRSGFQASRLPGPDQLVESQTYALFARGLSEARSLLSSPPDPYGPAACRH